MADVVLDCGELTRDGVAMAVYSDRSTPPLNTTDRYLVQNNGKMGVYVQTMATPVTVRAEIPQTLDGQSVAPRSVVVAPNSTVGIGHWPPNIYNNASAQVALTFSAVRGVKVFCGCMT